ncbi:MAG: hypothetical protein LBR80_08860, partial [Deltaproteobacteria bacterium]|nr:hypothetical protein [Deltaproteobacteria bacterium]
YENADLRASLKASQVRAASLEYDLKANMAALVEREADNRELARRYDKDLAALRAAFAATPEACAWSEDKIPDSVLEALGCGS